jgi:uncharacterized protein (DUF1330 family)
MAEGRLRARHVVIELRDYATAVACYRSPEYQTLIALRQPHAAADVLISRAMMARSRNTG